LLKNENGTITCADHLTSSDISPAKCADVRRYLEMDISLPSDSVHKFADEVCGHLLCSIGEVRRLFLVEDMVDTLKVGLVRRCHCRPSSSVITRMHRLLLLDSVKVSDSELNQL